MSFPTKTEIETLRKRYVDHRVRLVHTDDPYTHLKPGDEGIVKFVDDAGTIHINWDCGSGLGLVPGHDLFETID